MVKTTKIILSILLLFALLAVSGCTGTDGSVDDASSEVAEDAAMEEAEDTAMEEAEDTAMEEAEDTAMEEAATEESAADEEETESEEAETTEEVIEESASSNATLHECTSCHADGKVYTVDEMRTGIHKEAFSETNSVMHVDKCSECHNVEVDCTSCHDLPEVMKAQVIT